VVEGDAFGAVGRGLTIEAMRRYGPGTPGAASSVGHRSLASD
jgi:hypothetical protein